MKKRLINEKKNLTEKYVVDLYWEYDRMSSSGQDTLDKLAKLYGIETNQELEERLSKMSKEEMKQELERS
jgi:predicted HTH domain antitoxin